MRKVSTIVLSVCAISVMPTCLVLAVFSLIGGGPMLESQDQRQQDSGYSWAELLRDAPENKIEMVHVEEGKYKIDFKSGDVKYFEGELWENISEADKKKLMNNNVAVHMSWVAKVPTWPNKTVAIILCVVGLGLGFAGIAGLVRCFKSSRKAPT